MQWKPVLACAVVMGCAAPELELEHRGELDIRARGVALLDEGSIGHVGMRGTTCDFRSATGVTGDDYDYTGRDEEVLEASDDPSIGAIVLVKTPHGLHLTLPDYPHWSERQRDLPEPDGEVTEGGLFDGGVISVVDEPGPDCSLTWTDFEGDPAGVHSVPESACHGTELETDPARGIAWLTTDDGVIAVSPADLQVLGVDADLLAFDSHADALYAATQAGLVTAIEPDGAVRWTVDVGAPITSLTELGPRTQALVLTRSEGTGELVALDGATGAITGVYRTPSADAALVASGNGSVIGAVLPNSTHFFNVLD